MHQGFAAGPVARAMHSSSDMVPTLLICCSHSPGSVRHYVAAVRHAGWSGAIDLVAPGGPQPVDRERACGLVLTGGGDVHPRNWRTPEPVHQRTCADDARDALELPLVRWAWNRRLPLLGVCRGAQVLNVARGGDLVQDIPDATGYDADVHAHGVADEVDLRHAVELQEGSRLERLIGVGSVMVNSRHHQAVRRVGAGLVASAFHGPSDSRGARLIEAIEAVDRRRWAIGVQWHPENLVDTQGEHGAAARALFRAFVAELQRGRSVAEAARGRRTAVASTPT